MNIKDLEEISMNTQEMFDLSVLGVVGQGKQSLDLEEARCLYRAKCGAKCAVGHIIKDKYYSRYLEGFGINTSVVEAVNKSIGRNLTDSEHRMLIELQTAHDDYAHTMHTFIEEVVQVADQHGLISPVRNGV